MWLLPSSRMHATIEYMRKRWVMLEPCPAEFRTQCGNVHPVIPELLWHRHIRLPEEHQVFFQPSYDDHLHDPFLFTHMERAIERVIRAIDNREKILVFGDYDADGLTGSTIVIATLREFGSAYAGRDISDSIQSYIPHRDKEGYGLQMSHVEPFVNDGVNLVITVDNGISCVQEIAALAAAGVDTIILDHHQFGETLPPAIIIHPSVPGETYPFKALAAVGVAWKFASACMATMRSKGVSIPDGAEKWLLDLVAIATITDMVPLVGENRILEYYGLKVLNKTRRPGLLALFERAGLMLGSVGARDVGFAIGPRLNAPGRMEHASLGLDLLLAPDSDTASRAMTRIEECNRNRQDATKVMMREADELLESFTQDAALHVLWRSDWSPSLVGLVAGRVADRFGVPVVAIGKHGDQWIGSGRSFAHYDITEAVKRVGDGLLTRAGGHAQACGFALREDDHVPEFAQRLRDDASARIPAELIGPALSVHANAELRDLDRSLVAALRLLEPFGMENPEPTFVALGVIVATSQTVGREDAHLKIIAKSPDGTMRPFIGFGFGKRKDEARSGSMIDIAFSVSETEWNGSIELQCKIIDIRPSCETASTNLRVEDRLAQSGLLTHGTD